MEFAPLPGSSVSAAKDQVIGPAQVSMDGKPVPVGFHVLLRTGDRVDGEVFGTLKNIQGDAIEDKAGRPSVCGEPDHSSILRQGNRLFLVTQFECAPGAIYLARLQQDAGSGTLSAASLRYVDDSNEFGGYQHCAGMPTAWGTHLGSEEYEPDARTLDAYTGKVRPERSGYNRMGLYFGDQRAANPYYYGWIFELSLTSAKGDTEVVKHYAMGRASHELAYVMPDRKTVYLSDDGSNGGLYMFTADRPGDLSSGWLYAAKWQQTASDGGGRAYIDWVNLGHASDQAVRDFVAAKPRFEDLFNATTPDHGFCPDSYVAVNAGAGPECLQVKQGRERMASRLETRRYAAYKGATTEFHKAEGISFDPVQGRLYLAISEVDGGMLDNSEQDAGGNNDIRLPANACGTVFSLNLASNVKDASYVFIRSNYVARDMSAVLSGEPGAGQKSCAPDAIANPDNLAFVPDAHLLVIAEDSDMHANNFLWTYNVESNRLTRILAAPTGAEITSPFWYPDVNGWGYLMTVIQHPAGAQSQVGYLGPFPAAGKSRGSQAPAAPP